MKLMNLTFSIMIAMVFLCGCLNQGGHLSDTINIKNGSFHPSSITVPVGTTITWSNHNGSVETVTADDFSFDSNDLANGYEFRYTFLEPGNFSYYSKNNPLLRGNIIVISPRGNATSQAQPQILGIHYNASGQPSTSINLVAKNIAFDKNTITVPAGTEITVSFDNQDANIPHNFAVYDTEAAQRVIFQGNIITGPAKTTYSFKTPKIPGIYFFRCDVHPTIMKGQFVVVAPSSSSNKTAFISSANSSQTAIQQGMSSMSNTGSEQASSSSKSVIINLIAKNLAFDVQTITVPAGSNVTINFDNQDAKTPHNLAIYESEAAQVTIFQGKIITGPAKVTYNFVAPSQPGTYFFRCDVHPTIMKGQFVVQPANGSDKTPSQRIVNQQTNQMSPLVSTNEGLSQQGTGEGKSVLIEIKDYAFDPNWVAIPAGTTVIWRNYDFVPHTANSTAGTFDSGIIQTGKEFRYIFQNAGTYDYYCTIHPYMKGSIIVTPSNSPQPTPAEISPSQVGVTEHLSPGTMSVTTSTTSPQQPVSVIVDLLAKDMNFDKNKITVLAGSKVYINFYNLDVGVPHNFAIYTGSEAMNAIFQGQIIIGPAKITYSFDAPVDTGTYFFRCDVHPKVMTGDFYVVSSDNLPSSQASQAVPIQTELSMPFMSASAGSKNANASGQNITQGGQKSAVVDLTAEGIAFDKSTIEVPAGASVIVNFNNRDSGVPHNFAVYYAEDAKTVIFQGKIITGPNKISYSFVAPEKPGTYFYRCDVHPAQMKGQLIVR